MTETEVNTQNKTENYQIMIQQLLEEMQESKSTIDTISLMLDKNRGKLICQLNKIINKISYSTIKLKRSCRICGQHYSVFDLHKFNSLSSEQLVKLLNNVEIYLKDTEDYTIQISTTYIVCVFILAVIFPLYIAVYNMYVVQLFTNFLMLMLIYPTVYTIYQYQGCSKHDKYNTSYTLVDVIRALAQGIKKQSADTKHVWSCKYANKLAKYIIDQVKIVE